MGRVSGKLAIVTGAANGIGRAAARRLAQEGAIVVVADIDEQNGRAAAAEIKEGGNEAEFFELDVTEEAEWKSLIDYVLGKWKRLDILVNGASVSIIKPITEMSLQEFHKVSMVNAYGTFVGARAAILAMRRCAPEGETPQGSIVNVSSTAGLTGVPGGAAYCASKGAVKNMCKTMGVECGDARELIRINSVHPGVVRTASTEQALGKAWFEHAENFAAVPLQSYSLPEDVAEGILYLACDESRLVTGTELVIDAGSSLGGAPI